MDEMGGNFEKGVWNIECGSWREFEDRIEKFKRTKCKYIWRGQSCEKTLKPSIYRDSTPNGKTIRQHLYQFRKDMPWKDDLEQFLEWAKKRETAGVRKSTIKILQYDIPQSR
jgi:hypothetical protein